MSAPISFTDYEYSPRGWRTAVKQRGADDAVETDDLITRIQYTAAGQVAKVTRPDAVSSTFTYDDAQRLARATDSAGFYTQYTRDSAGNVTLEEIKGGSTTYMSRRRGFDSLGRQDVDLDLDPVGFGYDANDNLQSATDDLGHVVQYGYDALDRVSETRQDADGIGADTLLGYDALDNLVRVKDPKGLDTLYTYNGLSDLTRLVSPDTGTTDYGYDAAGNRKTWLDARGVSATTVYDALNRPTSVTYGGSDPRDNLTYGYDVGQSVCAADETFGVDRLSLIQNGPSTAPVSTLQYCYDRFGRIVRKVQSVNGKTFTLRYAYTAAGDLQSVTYPDGMLVSYTCNSTGRLNTIKVR